MKIIEVWVTTLNVREREGTFLQNLTMFKLFDFKIKTCDTLKHTKTRSTEQSVLRGKEK